MSCERLRPALIEAALGVPATAELSGHLVECTRCSAELERRRGLLARIDREIQAGMDVAAAPAFVARVRQQASQRKPAPWRATGWLLAVAAAVVLALGVLVLRRDAAAPSRAPSIAQVEPPPRQPAPPEPPESAAPLVPTDGAPSRLRFQTRRAQAEPEVLLRPGDQAVVRRLAETLRHQPVRAAVLLQAGFDPGGGPEPPVAPVAPIAIQRLSSERESIAPLAAVRQEIAPLSIPPAAPRSGPGDDEQQASETKKRSES